METNETNINIIKNIVLPGSSDIYQFDAQTLDGHDSSYFLPREVYVNPMVFKGTLGTGGTIEDLPTADTTTIGHTYKVITAGTYNSTVCNVGDIFVCSDSPAWVHVPAGDDSIANFTGATSSADGVAGLVPAPTKGYENRFLRGDGTWAVNTSANNKIITLEAGKGLKTGGSFTTNTSTDKTITFEVGAGTGISVADDSVGCNLNSTDSLGTIGTTAKLYPVGVDDNGQLCVNVPWENTTTTYSSAPNTATDYPVLFKGSSSTTTSASAPKFDASNFYYNPSTNTMTLGAANSEKGKLVVTSSSATAKDASITLGSTTITEAQLQQLLVLLNNTYSYDPSSDTFTIS